MKERPYWIALGIMVWGGILLLDSMHLNQFDQHAVIGPGFMVTMVGLGLVILGLMLAVQIRAGVSFEEQEAEDIDPSHARSYTGLAFAAAGCALPLLTLPYFGFVLTGAGSFALVARAFRSSNWAKNLFIGAVFSLICWFLFRKLGVQLGDLLPVLKLMREG